MWSSRWSLGEGFAGPVTSRAGAMVDEVSLDLVRSHMQDVRVPSHYDKVGRL